MRLRYFTTTALLLASLSSTSALYLLVWQEALYFTSSAFLYRGAMVTFIPQLSLECSQLFVLAVSTKGA